MTGQQQLILDLTHQLAPNTRWPEIRFDASIPLPAVKAKVARHTGSNDNYIRLQWCATDDKNEGPFLDDDSKCLADYGLQNRDRLHIYDDDPHSLVPQLVDDAPAAPAYRMSDEEYNRRPGNARDFLRQLKAQRPELFEKNAANTISAADLETNFPLQARCQIGEATSLRGSVVWRGRISESLSTQLGLKSRMAVGIALDTPFGNWDGKDGTTVLYEPQTEGRLRLAPWQDVQVGDFPELDPFETDEI